MPGAWCVREVSGTQQYLYETQAEVVEQGRHRQIGIRARQAPGRAMQLRPACPLSVLASQELVRVCRVCACVPTSSTLHFPDDAAPTE